MKYALVSDLQLDFLSIESQNRLVEHINSNTTDVDYIINAGDTAESDDIRQWFKQNLNKPVLTVMGNHDYYRKAGGRTLEYNKDLNMVLATLWTNFDNSDVVESEARLYIADFGLISSWGASGMEESYYEAIKFIEEHNPEIVVTHFGCHLNSIHPKYTNDSLNRYFVNDCSETIAKVKPKVWCHGHTHCHAHSSFDYLVGDTRVLCNPFGYPYENYFIDTYPIVKFEV